LGCSYLELDAHPDKARLMTIAFTVESGDAEGEYLRELNPNWQKRKKDVGRQIDKASK
jgi:hypothetical protein